MIDDRDEDEDADADDAAPEIAGGAAEQIDVRTFLKTHGLWAKKGFGQCFLRDRRVLSAIAESATRGSEVVIEIGAGLGALTSALADRGVRVIAIERDRTLVPILRELFRDRPSVEIVEGDATTIDLAALAPGVSRPALVGNLPYSVTTPLLLAFLRQRAGLGPATLMIQREVADRLLAGPGNKEYGLLTVLFQLHADLERRFEVGPAAFWPSPKVRSTVIGLRWLDPLRVPVEDPSFLERVVRTAFGQRRKTLGNSLQAGFEKERIARAAARAEIALVRRAETLTLKEFANLASALASDSKAEP